MGQKVRGHRQQVVKRDVTGISCHYLIIQYLYMADSLSIQSTSTDQGQGQKIDSTVIVDIRPLLQ